MCAICPRVQIQTLLHFLILSLPGPHPPTTTSEAIQDRLELFMDKLSMWQLMHGLESKKNENTINSKDDRDWMQVFCEDIVGPQ
jgi:hypothetical protein